MSKPNPVNCFEIPVTDLERAKAFYESALNVKLEINEMPGSQMASFPMEMGATGAAGTLIKGEGYTPSKAGTLVYLGVEDIQATLGRIEAKGGKTLVPKTSIGQYGFIAHFEDCEGNRVALHART